MGVRAVVKYEYIKQVWKSKLTFFLADENA